MIARSLVVIVVLATAVLAQPLVPVQFFVMSKCPDWTSCATTFGPAFAPLASILDLSVDVIATESGGTFNCMHGPTECTGNKQQLCAASLVKNETARSVKWFDFDVCQERDRNNIPANGQKCAQSTGLDYSKLSTCANGAQGNSLMSASIKRTRAAGVSTCCTVFVGGKQWCQHDGSWIRCTEGTTSSAMTKAVCSRYTGSPKPDVCNKIEEEEVILATA